MHCRKRNFKVILEKCQRCKKKNTETVQRAEVSEDGREKNIEAGLS